MIDDFRLVAKDSAADSAAILRMSHDGIFEFFIHGIRTLSIQPDGTIVRAVRNESGVWDEHAVEMSPKGTQDLLKEMKRFFGLANNAMSGKGEYAWDPESRDETDG
jgi:hypothetical protein